MEAWEADAARRKSLAALEPKPIKCRCGSSATLWPRVDNGGPSRVVCDGLHRGMRADDDPAECWSGPESYSRSRAVIAWNGLMRRKR